MYSLRYSGMFVLLCCVMLWSGCGSGEQAQTDEEQMTDESSISASTTEQPKSASVSRIKPKGDQLASTGTPAPKVRTYTIDAGTVITGELETPLSSKTNQVGDTFRLIVSDPIEMDGMAVIPKGTVIHGTVKTLQPAGRGSKKASMGLEFNSITLVSGKLLSITANQSLEGEEGSADAEIEGESKKKRNTALIAGGAAAGALAGKLLGKGKKETALGAIAGGAAGTAAALALKGGEVDLKPGTSMSVILGKSLQVPVRVATGSNVAHP